MTDIELALRLHRQGRKVVATAGCFDLLHLGHMEFLETARSLGDCLWVGVAEDTTVANLKGPGRPLYTQAERAEMLKFLECVDYVTVYQGLDPCAWLGRIQPTLYAKGYEYSFQDIPEKAIVEGYGGTVRFIEVETGLSTTQLIQRIRYG